MERTEHEVVEEKARVIPKSVWFILSYALFERYCLYGVLAILAVLLHDVVGLTQYWASTVYHVFLFFSFGFAVVSAIISDTYWGRFKTLLIGCSIFGFVGITFLFVGTMNIWYLLIPFVYTALLIISFSWGSLEPNLTAYCGDQYKLPLEAKGFSVAFGFLFITLCFSRVMGAIFSPLIRNSTACFGSDNCYPLLFGVFLCIKLVSIGTLATGKRSAVVLLPRGNMFVKFCTCIGHAIKLRFFTKNQPKFDYWLDHSIEKYGERLVADTKRVLSMGFIFVPGTLTASLFYQQSSRWIFQGLQMNGDTWGVNIPAESIPAIGAFLSILFVPLCESFIVPALKKIGIKTHLNIIVLGGFITATSFVLAAVLEYFVERYDVQIFWQMPQHVVMSVGEVLVFVQATQFFYTQAPVQMRSVMQSFFNLMIGFGNLIVAIIASSRIFNSMIWEFLLFAVIVYVAMLFFIYYSRKYVYVDPQVDDYEIKLKDEKN